MSDLSTFGPFVSSTRVKRDLATHIAYWLPTYLAWANRATGREDGTALLPFRAVRFNERVANIPHRQLPALVIMAPGLSGEPRRDGNRDYDAPWVVGFSVICASQNADKALALAGDYAAVLRNLLMQQAEVVDEDGEPVENVAIIDYLDEDVGEANGAIDAAVTASVCVGTVTVSVEVTGIANSALGPDVPIETAPADPVEIESADLEVTRL